MLAIIITHNLVQQDRTKHIKVDRHFMKEKLDNGLICTSYMITNSQLVDVLAKGLSKFKVLDNHSQSGNEQCLFTSLKESFGKNVF